MTRRLITVGHSPDPDDAFMFYALAHDKLDTGDLAFRHELQDIETLNRRALRGELEVSAVSIHAYAYLADKYALCNCGASMGEGYGPMVVARTKVSRGELKGKTIAIPGTLTTAYLTCRLWMDDLPFEHVVVPFDRILDAREVARAVGNHVVLDAAWRVVIPDRQPRCGDIARVLKQSSDEQPAVLLAQAPYFVVEAFVQARPL